MKNLKIFLLIFLFYFFSWVLFYKTGINSLPLQSEDVIPSIFTSIAIVKDQSIYLNNYYDMMVGSYPQPDDPSRTPFYLRKVGENYLSAFPIMSSIVALPAFLIYMPFIKTISWEDIYILSHLSGSFVMALNTVLIFYILNTVLKVKLKNSILLTLIYSFGTINLPLISQALWQHGTVQFFSLLTILFFLKEKYFLSFLFVGFAILSRPTSAILLVVLGIYLLFIKRTKFSILFRSTLGLLLPVAFFLVYNFTYYQDISNQGYSSQIFNSWLGNFPESFFGMWLSPSKGILIYSPVLLFTLIGIYKGYKSNDLVKISFWVIILHTLVLSKWKHWYGGYGFGYRMVSDILPFFIFPIAQLLEDFSKIYKKVLAVFGISFVIQFSGLIFFDSIWHNAYDTGFRNTSWLWSIRDSEAVFNIRRVLVKTGYMEKACEKCLPN